jgi:hypothetical protein
LRWKPRFPSTGISSDSPEHVAGFWGGPSGGYTRTRGSCLPFHTLESAFLAENPLFALRVVSFVFGFRYEPVQEERKVAAKNDVWRQSRDGFGPNSFGQVFG